MWNVGKTAVGDGNTRDTYTGMIKLVSLFHDSHLFQISFLFGICITFYQIKLVNGSLVIRFRITLLL